MGDGGKDGRWRKGWEMEERMGDGGKSGRWRKGWERGRWAAGTLGSRSEPSSKPIPRAIACDVSTDARMRNEYLDEIKLLFGRDVELVLKLVHAQVDLT